MKHDKQKAPTYRVQVLDRAIDILGCFSFQNRELSLTEIVRETGLKKPTAKRLLANLTSRDFLSQDPGSKRYHLGLRLFELGGIVFSSFSLRRAAAYPMSRLQKETGATVLLAALMEDKIVYIDKRDSRGMLSISPHIGLRRPMHHGMLGLVLMAYLDQREIKRILRKNPLEPYTPFSITDEDAFNLRLETIRKQGYLIEKEEAFEGVYGVAAPIRDSYRKVIAALGIAITSENYELREDLDRIVDLVKNTCDDISADLGYLKI